MNKAVKIDALHRGAAAAVRAGRGRVHRGRFEGKRPWPTQWENSSTDRFDLSSAHDRLLERYGLEAFEFGGDGAEGGSRNGSRKEGDGNECRHGRAVVATA